MASLLPSTRFLLRRQLPRPFCEPNIRLFPLRPFHSSPFIASSDEFEGFTDTESVKTGPAAENGAKGKGKAKVTNDPKTWPEGWENDADFWPDFQEEDIDPKKREELPNFEDAFGEWTPPADGGPAGRERGRSKSFVMEDWENPHFKDFLKKQRELTRKKARNILSYPGSMLIHPSSGGKEKKDGFGRYEEENEELSLPGFHEGDPVRVYMRGDMVAIRFGLFEVTGMDFSVLVMNSDHFDLAKESNSFDFTNSNYLTNFAVEWEMPICIVDAREEPQSFRLTRPEHERYRRGKNWNDVPLRVRVEVDHSRGEENAQSFSVKLKHPLFDIESGWEGEDEVKGLVRGKREKKDDKVEEKFAFFECLDDLRSKLPEGFLMKSCYTCGWSKFTPLGYSVFGGLGCFKNLGEEHFDSQSARNIHKLWGSKERDSQENYRCKDFRFRSVPHRMPRREDFPTKKFQFDLNS